MKVALIVAMDESRGIGRDNDLMWHLPRDMKFFKEMTNGQIVVMGRKNYDSIPERFRPLLNRENVVLTRNSTFKANGCKVFNSMNDCLNHYSQEEEKIVFIIGGAEIYNLALQANCVDEMYITHVHANYDADTFFPTFDENNWTESILFKQEIDTQHASAFTVKKYLKKAHS